MFPMRESVMHHRRLRVVDTTMETVPAERALAWTLAIAGSLAVWALLVVVVIAAL
jgi:hypothetical protein